MRGGLVAFGFLMSDTDMMVPCLASIPSFPGGLLSLDAAPCDGACAIVSSDFSLSISVARA